MLQQFNNELISQSAYEAYALEEGISSMTTPDDEMMDYFNPSIFDETPHDATVLNSPTSSATYWQNNASSVYELAVRTSQPQQHLDSIDTSGA